jgi:hypothetical protein
LVYRNISKREGGDGIETTSLQLEKRKHEKSRKMKGNSTSAGKHIDEIL